MATLLRGLCLILLLILTGSRPRAGGRRESPHSSPYWSQGAVPLLKRAIDLRRAGDYAHSELVYRQGLDEARRLGDSLAAVKFLISIGGCQLFDFRYREAMATFLEARALALSIGDREDAGAIAVNLANVYQQVWDFPAANRAAEDGLANAPPDSYFMPQLLILLGRLRANTDPAAARQYFSRALEIAPLANSPAVEPQAWDLLGETDLNNGRLDDAEREFREALRLRTTRHARDTGYSYSLLGSLALARRDFPTAERYTEMAIRAEHKGEPSWPLHRLWHQRGEIRQAQGRLDAALVDFSAALDRVGQWRTQVVPARSALTGANIGLEEKIFRSFIQLAANLAVRRKNPSLAARAWEALETNRAASLRESLALADVWKQRLPAEYWELLGQLGALQARQTKGTRSTSGAISRITLRITELEVEAGIGNSYKKEENFRTQSSLIHFQNGIAEDELLLSFALGEKESHLWAVGRKSVGLYRIADEKEIAREVRAFRGAVRAGGGGGAGLEAAIGGARLYRMLFGQLSEKDRSKRRWLLSVEGVLFELPFPALVVQKAADQMDTVYLVDKHSLQIIPGVSLLKPSLLKPGLLKAQERTPAKPGFLLAVGDPVYNTADPRWHVAGGSTTSASRWWSASTAWSRWTASANSVATDLAIPGQLARLVGSSGEVRAAVQGWSAVSGTATVLEGSEATRAKFQGLLERRPSVIHLATHVTADPSENSREQSFIAFSLGAGDRTPFAEVLSTTEVGGLRVPEALVVMTGCDTGAGDAAAGAGLLGLSRAWLVAGARGVLTTSWPTEDSGGEMFSRFYQQLARAGAAEALRLSQIEMAHSRSWRAKPLYWASYSLVGGER